MIGVGASRAASCVAFGRATDAEGPSSPNPFGVLILGPPGSGKSSLALDLVAFGARLVGDDRIVLTCEPGPRLLASAAATIHGLVEARGVGLLRLPALARCEIGLVVDLTPARANTRPDLARLPDQAFFNEMGCKVPLVCAHAAPLRASAIAALAKCGVFVDPDRDARPVNPDRSGDAPASERRNDD